MRLSTAIRIGSMTTKQIKGRFTDGGNGRCALGAALDACNVHVSNDHSTMWQKIRETFPDVSSEWVQYVWTHNDGVCGRDYTREEIADHIEALENEHDGYIQTGVIESKPLELIAQEAK